MTILIGYFFVILTYYMVNELNYVNFTPYRRATGPIRRAKGGWTAQEVCIFHVFVKFYVL